MFLGTFVQPKIYEELPILFFLCPHEANFWSLFLNKMGSILIDYISVRSDIYIYSNYFMFAVITSVTKNFSFPVICTFRYLRHLFLFFSFLFSSLLTWVFLIYISIVIPFPSFRANIPLNLPLPFYMCVPLPILPHYCPSPNNHVTGGLVLAGPRASPSTDALTRLFIVTYAVGSPGSVHV